MDSSSPVVLHGYDLSNITFIRGDTGWLIVDPLTTEQTARDALALVNAQLGARPVHAVIYTHSHTDHPKSLRDLIKG